MIRLFIVVEGDTELAFVRHTLGPYLNSRNVFTAPIEVSTKRDRRTREKLERGGGHWKHWRRDIEILTQSQRGSNVRFSSFFDLYGLPDDFPSVREHGAEQDTRVRVELLEGAMARVINDSRFIPYLQRHEFEALVLAALDSLGELFEDASDRAGILALRASLGTVLPEDINDGKSTAPSKRLLRYIPGYQKAIHGPLVTEAVGLGVLRARCPRFDAWVARLERLGEEI